MATRRDRFAARYLLWSESSIPRVRGCGKTIRSGEGVAVKVTGSGPERRAGIAGVQSCGSVWVCPCCAAKISAHRQGEIELALGRWHERGGRVGLLTLTMRHHKGHSLAALWDAVSKAWARVTSGRRWRDEQDQYGVIAERTVKTGRRKGQKITESRIHFIRVVEVTHGENGWHVHLHVLLLLAPETSAEAVRLLGDQMFTRWRAALLDQGMPAPTWTHGVDARRLDGDSAAVTLSEYFTKANYSASMEVGRADLKDARGDNRSPFAILRGVMDGDADDLDLWHEWEEGSRCRRQMTLSHGLRELLLADVEDKDDETIADEDLDGEELVTVPKTSWHWICGHRLVHELLEAAEHDDDGETVQRWLLAVELEVLSERESRLRPPSPPRITS